MDLKKRITSLTEKTTLTSGDFIAVDNDSGGTKKYNYYADKTALDQAVEDIADLKGTPTVFTLSSSSDVSRQFEYEFKAGKLYTITNSTTTSITFKTRLTKTGPTVQDVGGIVSNKSVAFVCSTDAFWFNSWSPNAGSIVITEANAAFKTVPFASDAEGIACGVNIFGADYDLINGGYADATGVLDLSRTDYVAAPELVYISKASYVKFKFIGSTQLTLHFVFFDANYARISNFNGALLSNEEYYLTIPSGTVYISICGTYQYQTAIDPANYKYYVTLESGKPYTDEAVNATITNNDLVYLDNWTNNIYYFRQGNRSNSANRIGLGSMFLPAHKTLVYCDSGYKLAAGSFSTNVEAVANETGTSGWVDSAILEKGVYYLINFKRTNDGAIQPAKGLNLNIHFVSLLSAEDSSSYVIGADSIKQIVSTTSLGTLTYHQSFCMYDGKYYSTDGDNIAVQNADFSAVSTTALSVGHGNAFQLGNAGKAYISGWNDNKVYVLNMSTIIIDSVINLPTTGYTTAVIDDLNHLAYIFQRSTSPSTVENYNFIVYDYQNDQIKSTRVINAFSAMQAADFYNGRIAVLWGMGTTASPSGMAIYNTNGDILAEYTLSVFASAEPEGVFFKRDTGELLISLIDKNVYALS